MAARARRCVRRCLCGAAVLCGVVSGAVAHAATATATTTTTAAADDGRWPVWLLCVFCVVTVMMSAMYCGLTIGLLGMDMVYMEIIAAAGREPDRSYATSILPVRRLGHRLLVTLLLGNMLTLVITSQLVAAILRASELVNFVVGTLVVLVFGEIVPMSICNNQQYALRAGSLCLPALQLSLVVLYPIAAPLALLLDCLVHHDAGMVYDRQELKKLMRVHCDKYAERSGIDAEQVHMMVSALEMNEVTVGAVMTPMSEVLMLDANEQLDAQLQRRLWEYGKSRLPVHDGDRNHIIGVLYVKDLLQCVSGALAHASPRCVRDFVAAHSRSVFVVEPTTLVRDTLLFFESGVSHLMFVIDGGHGSSNANTHRDAVASGAAHGQLVVAPPTRTQQQPQPQPCNTSPRSDKDGGSYNSHSHSQRRHRGTHGSGGAAVTTTTTTKASVAAAAAAVTTPRPVVVALDALRDGQLTSREVRFLGIISLEDVIEQLIGAEIYDEDEMQRDSPLWDYAAAMEDASLPLQVPVRLPRVNFYSYGVPARPHTRAPHASAPRNDNNNDDDKHNDNSTTAAVVDDVAASRMTEDQKWALANYMAHACVFLASWSVPQVRYLLDHVQERIVYVDDDSDSDSDSDNSNNEDKTNSHNNNNNDSGDQHRRRKSSGSSRRSSDEGGCVVRDAAAGVAARVVLYTAGVPSNTYTLVLSGGVQLTIGTLRTELRSFAALNEDVLLSLQLHTPDYTAVVHRTSRLLQISTDALLHVVRRIAEARARVGLPPVRLTLLPPAASAHAANTAAAAAAETTAVAVAQTTTATTTTTTGTTKSDVSFGKTTKTYTSRMATEDARVSSV